MNLPNDPFLLLSAVNTKLRDFYSNLDKTYSSTNADENALLIDTSDSVTITNPTVTKSGNSDGGDNCNF